MKNKPLLSYLQRILHIFLIGDFICRFHSLLCGQNYPFREYSVADGCHKARQNLSGQQGFPVDRYNGISRFDGIEFRNYFRHDGLPSNIISKIIEDDSGYVYALSGTDWRAITDTVLTSTLRQK